MGIQVMGSAVSVRCGRLSAMSSSLSTSSSRPSVFNLKMSTVSWRVCRRLEVVFKLVALAETYRRVAVLFHGLVWGGFLVSTEVEGATLGSFMDCQDK